MTEIRLYVQQDRAALEACIVEFQEHERTLQPDNWTGEQIATFYLDYLIEQSNNNGQFLVAEVDGEIVGYTCIWPEKNQTWAVRATEAHGLEPYSELRLSDIFVSSKCRGKGIGKLLLTKVEEFARENGHSRILLNVLANNSDSIAVYHKTGYVDYERVMTKTIIAIE